MNRKTIIILIILVLLGVILFINRKDSTIIKPSSTDTSSDVRGCYLSLLSKDVYTLTIDKQSDDSVSGTLSFKNYQKDSSSGVFVGTFKDNILQGDYTFDSEGLHSIRQVIFKKIDNGFVEGFGDVIVIGNKEQFRDPSVITYDVNSTFIKSPDCNQYSVYTDPVGLFSFKYNPNFTVVTGNKKQTIQDWRVGSTTKGVTLATLRVDRGYMPSTNFSEAKLTIARSSDPVAKKYCLLDKGDTRDISTIVNIGNIPFTKVVIGDAGAGNFYNTTSYRSILEGNCYTIEYTIHSTNIGNYSIDQGIKEFDQSKIENALMATISSLRFQLASN